MQDSVVDRQRTEPQDRFAARCLVSRNEKHSDDPTFHTCRQEHYVSILYMQNPIINFKQPIMTCYTDQLCCRRQSKKANAARFKHPR